MFDFFGAAYLADRALAGDVQQQTYELEGDAAHARGQHRAGDDQRRIASRAGRGHRASRRARRAARAADGGALSAGRCLDDGHDGSRTGCSECGRGATGATRAGTRRTSRAGGADRAHTGSGARAARARFARSAPDHPRCGVVRPAASAAGHPRGRGRIAVGGGRGWCGRRVDVPDADTLGILRTRRVRLEDVQVAGGDDLECGRIDHATAVSRRSLDGT